MVEQYVEDESEQSMWVSPEEQYVEDESEQSMWVSPEEQFVEDEFDQSMWVSQSPAEQFVKDEFEGAAQVPYDWDREYVTAQTQPQSCTWDDILKGFKTVSDVATPFVKPLLSSGGVVPSGSIIPSGGVIPFGGVSTSAPAAIQTPAVTPAPKPVASIIVRQAAPALAPAKKSFVEQLKENWKPLAAGGALLFLAKKLLER